MSLWMQEAIVRTAMAANRYAESLRIMSDYDHEAEVDIKYIEAEIGA